MRTIDSSISVLKPSNFAWWHSSWTGRFVLAALLIAAAAFALMPDRTSADHNTTHTRCTTAAGAANTGLIDDCVALVTAAGSLVEDTTNGIDYNWIGLTSADPLPRLTDNDWTDVTVSGTPARVTAVELPDGGLTGALHADWAKLTALTTLDLSGNGLGGMVDRSVWEFFDENLETLELGGNKDLQPSPTLNLMAAATKIATTGDDEGKTQVTLSFDNIWYTTEVAAHEYRYSYSADGETTWGPNDTEDSMGWMSMDTACYVSPATDPPTKELCAKDDGATPAAARIRQSIMSAALPDADTYIFEVRAVKSTTDTATVRSEDSRIDVVGPQTLTAKSMYILDVAVAYTSASSDDTTILEDPEVDASDADNVMLNFNPLAEGKTTVKLEQAHGSHTFPVEGPVRRTARPR